MAKSPEETLASMVLNLKKTTGKALEEWLKIVKTSKAVKHGEIVKFLKEKHGIGHGYANLIAHQHLQPAGADAPSGADLVDAQYAGAKAELRPIFEALIAAIRKFGADVEVSPKKGYVSLRRSKQFALIQPSTATRLDIGINLKGKPTTKRLEASGSFNAMVTHRVRVASLAEADKELISWLREAYDGA